VPYKVPVAFHWVDEIPRSEVGKILRKDLVASLRTAAPAT
jgi:acyl-coenzyme A synthetase/AMP-(fatty) acid ligase